ncbi:MAG: UPF0175 family protein [Acidobacteria bacterium]|nr:UPF0175 family protein [Acidobacteriota bacterium]
MNLTLQIPDELALAFPPSSTVDLPRRVIEALAVEAYREGMFSSAQVSSLLGISRAETEDFLGRHGAALADYDHEELNREARLFDRPGAAK